INIGNACNNECRFCMVDHDSRGLIDYKTIESEIIRARKNGFESIGFLGGEFTLHPEVLKIIKLAKILNFKIIHIISNGRKYQDENFVKQLINNGVNRFSVSIHSHKPEVEDYLTQRPGGFEEKIQGLKNLIKLNQLVSANLVINNLNYKEILETLKYFSELGIKDFRLNFIWLHGRAKDNNDLFLKYTDFLPWVEEIINLAKEKKFTIAFEGIPACLIKDKDKLNYIGELRDLNTEVVAFNNPNKARENFNWQERKTNEFKIKHEKCQECVCNNSCEGVWRDYINLFGWKEFF
ncbi:MAG: radical SAM protein, partial [Candidatus Parcubacteria bacterium]|nr:radical SAM protein [Candidatus Parcubacteria bacterium]